MSYQISDGGKKLVTVHELLEQSSQAALDLQRENGSFPPGKNGPYEEKMTPVRTTSMWLITLTKAYQVSGDTQFYKAANMAAEYLMRNEVRPHGYTFHARKSNTKDKCNQLVGQALPIKALAYSGQCFDQDPLIETAHEVFEIHPFNKELGLWEKVEIDGTKISYDRTLNHQLLFAGASSFIKRKEVNNKVDLFLKNLKQNMHIRSNGIVRHFIKPSVLSSLRCTIKNKRHWPILLNEIMHRTYTYSKKHLKKEIGYQPTNILALSWLKINRPKHDIWHSYGDNWTIDSIFSDYFKEKIFQRDINLGSGMPGIATATGYYILQDLSENELKKWVQRDITKIYNPETNLFDNIKTDPIGNAANIHQMVHLPNIKVKLQ